MQVNIIKKTMASMICSLGLLFISAPSQAIPISLDAGGTSFDALFLQGSSNIGVIYYHGRGGNPDGNFVKQSSIDLNSQGYTTLSIANPVPIGGTSFGNYANQESSIDDQVFARLDAAISQMSASGVDHIVLAGMSLGSRFMTAATAAWETGLFDPTADVDLVGLIGAGMYSSLAGSAPTAANPANLGDFNVLDTHSNLGFINNIPVFDVFGDQDFVAADAAGIRASAYAGAAVNYQQMELSCPPNNGQYFALLSGGVYVPYYGTDGLDIRRCHQQRDGYLADGSGGYIKAVNVRTPRELAIRSFMQDSVVPRTQVPEPASLALLLFALPMLYAIRRRKH